MEGVLCLPGGGDSGGGAGGTGASSGGSINGSASTVSKAEVLEQDYVGGLSSEVSLYPDEAELELGLGLSLGGVLKAKAPPGAWGEYGRILTAKDFPSMGSRGSSDSSSSSSLGKTNASVGTKRAADSVAPEGRSANAVSQVVGWPPIRASRMNSLVNQAKASATDDENGIIENGKNKDIVNKTIDNSNKNNIDVKEKRHLGNSPFVKVKKDGIPIGRKVDLNAHSCYETLAQTLEDMFHVPNTINAIRSSGEDYGMVIEAKRPSRLLDGSSEFVLTYEDKEGDWMLVGDVPWGMFLNTVKRLRIMRTSDVNGLAPRFQGRDEAQRSKPV